MTSNSTESKLIGQTIGIWQVTGPAERPADRARQGRFWTCRCTACGAERDLPTSQIRSGKIKCRCQYGRRGPKGGNRKGPDATPISPEELARLQLHGNTRTTLTVNGVTQPLGYWARLTSTAESTLRKRLALRAEGKYLTDEEVAFGMHGPTPSLRKEVMTPARLDMMLDAMTAHLREEVLTALQGRFERQLQRLKDTFLGTPGTPGQFERSLNEAEQRFIRPFLSQLLRDALQADQPGLARLMDATVDANRLVDARRVLDVGDMPDTELAAAIERAHALEARAEEVLPAHPLDSHIIEAIGCTLRRYRVTQVDVDRADWPATDERNLATARALWLKDIWPADMDAAPATARSTPDAGQAEMAQEQAAVAPAPKPGTARPRVVAPAVEPQAPVPPGMREQLRPLSQDEVDYYMLAPWVVQAEGFGLLVWAEPCMTPAQILEFAKTRVNPSAPWTAVAREGAATLRELNDRIDLAIAEQWAGKCAGLPEAGDGVPAIRMRIERFEKCEGKWYREAALPKARELLEVLGG